MKYRFMRAHQGLYPVGKMCRALKVSRGGYYAWLKRPLSKRAKENRMLAAQIERIYRKSHGRYGSPRITHELSRMGHRVSRPRVARLMRRSGLSAKRRKKFTVTTNSNHKYSISPNLLDRDFSVSQFARVWLSDITYIRTAQGWLFLTVILDLYNRMIVGWAMSDGLSAAETSIAALQQAWKRFHPRPNLIFHSDRGVQYACHDFRNQLTTYRMIQSMSRKGNCWDNAVAESFFATLKKELVYQNSFKTKSQARQAIFEYIEIFYNRQRKHSYLEYESPVQFMSLNGVA